MSLLVDHIRPILFSHLSDHISPKVKKACWDLLNAIDEDLGVMGYNKETCSSDTQEELERFLVALAGNSLPDLEIEEVINEEVVEEVKEDNVIELEEKDLKKKERDESDS